jgi:hypothetical protein
MRKCLVLLEFGGSLGWTQKFIDTVSGLGEYGWNFKLFTPNPYEGTPNFEVIWMPIGEFNTLVESKLGTNPQMFITPEGIPNFHMTDFHIMVGKIFEDYLKDYDFWGTIGNDCVVGRLDHFVPDSLLASCDVFTDDIGQFNAHFCLWRNEEEINTLFKKIPNWENVLTQGSCPGCLGTGDHQLCSSDEKGMTWVMEKFGSEYQFTCPKYFLIHSHDRLENHKPVPKLTIKDDGSLWELLADTETGGGRRHPFFGREIAYFHFSNTKKWPTIS